MKLDDYNDNIARQLTKSGIKYNDIAIANLQRSHQSICVLLHNDIISENEAKYMRDRLMIKIIDCVVV